MFQAMLATVRLDSWCPIHPIQPAFHSSRAPVTQPILLWIVDPAPCSSPLANAVTGLITWTVAAEDLTRIKHSARHQQPLPNVSTGKLFCHSRESGNENTISREFPGSRESIIT
jgi:hypothetical protein